MCDTEWSTHCECDAGSTSEPAMTAAGTARGADQVRNDMMTFKTLFVSQDIAAYLDEAKRKLIEAIASLAEDQALNTEHSALCEDILHRYTINPPTIDKGGISTTREEVQLSARRDPDCRTEDRSQPFFVTGTKITCFVPYHGNYRLLLCKPSQHSLGGGLQAELRDYENEVVLTYSRGPHEISEIEDVIQQDLDQLRQYLNWVADDVARYNDALVELVDQHVAARRKKVLADKKLVERLGFPLKRRTDAPTTCTTPTVKRRLAPRVPSASAQPYLPEPEPVMDDYENILGVISNMATMIERSPQNFAGIHEEGLRDLFLVQLNGQYEGQATGETFNNEGKTDILVRVKNRNVFIAECKIWSGRAGMSKAIDQLLGYTCWRDTKIALLLFNRNKNMTKMLEKAHDSLKAHPNFKTQLDYPSETGFRCVFTHRDDPNRELTLTTLVFDVPA